MAEAKAVAIASDNGGCNGLFRGLYSSSTCTSFPPGSCSSNSKCNTHSWTITILAEVQFSYVAKITALLCCFSSANFLPQNTCTIISRRTSSIDSLLLLLCNKAATTGNPYRSSPTFLYSWIIPRKCVEHGHTKRYHQFLWHLTQQECEHRPMYNHFHAHWPTTPIRLSFPSKKGFPSGNRPYRYSCKVLSAPFSCLPCSFGSKRVFSLLSHEKTWFPSKSRQVPQVLGGIDWVTLIWRLRRRRWFQRSI